MENITIGQVTTSLAFLVSFIGSIIALLKYAKKIFNNAIKPINEKLMSLETSSIKTNLVDFINDMEHDVPKSQIQKLNAHELYDRYTELGGNSYVHEHWEKLVKEGKI